MILGFSTSGPYCGAALWRDSDIVAARHEEIARGQVERLMPMVKEVLSEADAGFGDLDAIGVGTGPGNFTGIRISVSAARGLALGLEIPAVGVSLLEAQAQDHPQPVLASIAAGRNHLYLQRFAGQASRGPELCDMDDIGDWAHPGLTCIGDMQAEIAGALGAACGPARHPPACAVARIAASRWQDDPPRPAPLYLRAPDAAPGRDRAPRLLP